MRQDAADDRPLIRIRRRDTAAVAALGAIVVLLFWMFGELGFVETVVAIATIAALSTFYYLTVSTTLNPDTGTGAVEADRTGPIPRRVRNACSTVFPYRSSWWGRAAASSWPIRPRGNSSVWVRRPDTCRPSCGNPRCSKPSAPPCGGRPSTRSNTR